MHHSGINCESVSVQCPVENSIYGYYPNLGANLFYAVLFGLLLFVQVIQGVRSRMWTFMVMMILGCLAECLGYVGRVLLHSNPFSSNGFEIQICCLIIAPAFLAAGIYVIFKHVVRALGPEHSYIPAKYYLWIFFPMDILCLILQGAGGGIAATAKSNTTQLNLGSNLMLGGIVWQVCNLLVFAGFAGPFLRSLYIYRRNLTPSAQALARNLRFRLFLAAVLFSTLAIFTRCVFRIAEMANGWSNPIMQSEVDFMVLDGGMCAIAAILLTVFHPGYYFKEAQGDWLGSEKTPSDAEQFNIERRG